MSSDDESKNLKKYLFFLRKEPIHNFIPEEISREINLPLETVKSITEEAILNQWVDVDHRGDDGTPVVKINYDGNKKLNRLAGKADSFSSQTHTNINIVGSTNVNIGKNNKINSNTNKEHGDNSQKKWLKIGVIIAGITLAVIIILGIIPFVNNQDTSNSKNAVSIETNYGTIIINPEQNIESELTKAICENKEFGILVEIPNPMWKCINYSDYLASLGKKITDESVVGTLFVGRTTGESIVVSIRDISILRNLSIHEFIDYLISEYKNAKEPTVEIKNRRVFSPTGPAHWELENSNPSMPSGKMYHLNILWIEEPYVYVLEQSAEPPEFISSEIKEEMNKILESFRGI